MQKIGALVRQIRKRKGWSQTQMAAALEVAKSTVSLYEHNKRDPFDGTIFLLLFGLADDEEKDILREWIKNRRRRRSRLANDEEKDILRERIKNRQRRRRGKQNR